jgi:2-amino-4-hydroxy-6-hydroxymethyldihydropteridine diphosphokinase
MSSKTVYIALGSNLGDRAETIAAAIEAMNLAGIHVVRESSLYATEPVDAPRQPWFLNAVVEATTALMPRQLLRGLQAVEKQFGRRRTGFHGPRTLDLDILFYGSSVIRSRDLQVPHPRIGERRFVLVPLAELAPALRHPVLRKTMTELLAETPDTGQIRIWHAPAAGTFIAHQQLGGAKNK